MKNILYLFLILLIIFIGCKDTTYSYTGQVLSIKQIVQYESTMYVTIIRCSDNIDRTIKFSAITNPESSNIEIGDTIWVECYQNIEAGGQYCLYSKCFYIIKKNGE